MVKANPGISEEEARGIIEDLRLPGETFDQAAEREVLIAEASIREAAPEEGRSSSGGGEGKPLPNARAEGDIFFAPASTALVPHGHTGMYWGVREVLEAPGKDGVTHMVSASSVKSKPGGRLMSSGASAKVRKSAVEWGWHHKNRPYNLVFFKNKTIESSKYNCSQYVWAAYKQAGWDLDGDGGWGVYPVDIRDSRLVSAYRTL